jgi:hypothetical protein
LILLVFNTLFVFYLEQIHGHGPFVSTISLFFNVIFILVFVALGNAAVRRLRPSLSLNRGELIVVYVMLTISTSIMGHDMFQVLISMMTTGYWFATPENRWDQMLGGTTPDWLLISGQDVLYGYWNGTTTLYQSVVLQAWLEPVLWWTGFTCVLVFVLVCMSVVLRPLWADRERLTFPIIHLPLELTNPDTPLLRNPLMWIGFGLAGLLDLINGLNYIYPSVPAVPLYHDLGQHIHNDPWTGVGWLPVTFNPSVIGLCFLMPLDLLFSCTFFFFYWKAMFVIAKATGVSEGYGWGVSEAIFPYANEQMFGGFIAVALGSAIIGRQYFRQVWLRLLRGSGDVDDSREGMSYRVAFIGALLGVGLLVAFSIRAGMSPALASPVHDYHFAGPDRTLAVLLGTMNVRQRDLGMFQQYYWFNRAYRGHPVACALEGFQMSARGRSRPRAVTAAIVLAVPATALVAFWGWLHHAYSAGAASAWGYGANWFGGEAYNRLESWIRHPKAPNFVAGIAMAVGFGISMLLAAARTRFVGWPLHPVAYALSASWSIHLVWMPMLIAWIVKAAVLRYGGLRFYLRAVPFFFGMILGESMVGCAWPLIGLIFNVPAYNFFGF